MNNFYGVYNYTIDSNGRFSIPARLRKALSPEDREIFIICKGINSELRIYPPSNWEKYEKQISSLPITTDRIHFDRDLYSSLTDSTMDSQGRITISPIQRGISGITREITLIGQQNFIELWDTKKYEKYVGLLSDDETNKNENKKIFLRDVIEKIAKLEPELILHLQKNCHDLQKLNPRVFEELIAEFLAYNGFKVQLVGQCSFTHADIFAVKSDNELGIEQNYYFEVKRWKKKVNIGVISEVIGAIQMEKEKMNWNLGVIVALGGFQDFKNYTIEQIRKMGIELKDEKFIMECLEGYEFRKNGLWLPSCMVKINPIDFTYTKIDN